MGGGGRGGGGGGAPGADRGRCPRPSAGARCPELALRPPAGERNPACCFVFFSDSFPTLRKVRGAFEGVSSLEEPREGTASWAPCVSGPRRAQGRAPAKTSA